MFCLGNKKCKEILEEDYLPSFLEPLCQTLHPGLVVHWTPGQNI